MIRLIYLADYSESCSYKLLRGIVDYSKSHSPWTIIRMPVSYRDSKGLDGVLAWALSRRVDVIIGRFEHDDDVEMFERNGILAIAQDHRVRFDSIPNITGNYRHTGELAARFFIRNGFRNFAFFGVKDTVWSSERRDGFIDMLAKGGAKNAPYIYETPPNSDFWSYGTENIRDWISSLPNGTGMLTCDDNFGSRAMDTCRSLGINVPGSIAILGVDNDEMISSLTDPPLSSIDLDVTKAGYEVGRMIDEYLATRDRSRLHDIIIDGAEIVGRVSTDYFSTEDIHVRTALTFIHQNINSNLSVNDIVARVPLSRRLLEIRFKKVTNNSIHEYCFRRRMELFAHLLETSDESIARLSEIMGFNDMKNISRQFRNFYGMTPRDYRNAHRRLNG